MSKIRSKLEAEVENVGENFANEARAMHDGDSPNAFNLRGSKIKDAQALIEDGIPVIPMPWKNGALINLILIFICFINIYIL